MELEKLQQSWQKLSARLERHEMLKKEELRNFFENKTTSYMRQTMKNRYTQSHYAGTSLRGHSFSTSY